MEKFIEYVLQFGDLNKQQIELIKSKATEIELRKDDYYWEAGKTIRQIGFLTDGIDLDISIVTDKNAKPAQVALTWLLAQKPFIVPIPGTSKLHRLQENIGAINVSLTNDELSKINSALAAIKSLANAILHKYRKRLDENR